MTKSPPGKGANISNNAKSLAAYAKDHRQHHNGRCWLWNISEYGEVRTAYEAGTPPKTIWRWLVEECDRKEATYAKIYNCLHHHDHEQVS